MPNLRQTVSAPHTEGWGPTVPHKDYTAAYRKPDQQTAPLPETRPWYQGRSADRPGDGSCAHHLPPRYAV